MKWHVLALFAVLAAIPATVSAQPFRVLPIGHIAYVPDRSPTLWGLSGMTLFEVRTSIGNVTPIMRSEAMDARTVEILSRTQAPPLRPSDVRVVSERGRDYIVVRRILLTEVTPQDARAAGVSRRALAARWAASVRRVFPVVAPAPNRFGV